VSGEGGGFHFSASLFCPSFLATFPANYILVKRLQQHHIVERGTRQKSLVARQIVCKADRVAWMGRSAAERAKVKPCVYLWQSRFIAPERTQLLQIVLKHCTSLSMQSPQGQSHQFIAPFSTIGHCLPAK